MRRAPRRRSILCLLGVSAAAAAGVPLYALAAPDPSDLPDMVSEAPGAPHAEVYADGRLLLRFEGYVSNGASPSTGSALEIRASDPDVNGVMRNVRQMGGAEFPGDPGATVLPPAAGGPPRVQFETADDHLHFHLKDAAEYTLWDETRTAQVALAQKTEAGFCLEDSDPMGGGGSQEYTVGQNDFCWQQEEGQNAWIPGSRPGQTLVMGISPRFRDVYESDLTYQWIDISNVQPGRYALAGRVDPRNVILERDEGNNGYAFRDEPVVVAGHLAQPVSARQTGGPVTVTLQAQTFGSPGARRFRILSAPAHGTIDRAVGEELTGATVTYTPKPGYRGSDGFTYAAVSEGSPYPRTPAAATASLVGDEVSVAISGAPARLIAGTAVKLSATVANAGGGVTWGASAGTITGSGLYTAPSTPPPGGVVTIQARSVERPDAVGEARIRIVPARRQAPAPPSGRTAGGGIERSARQLLINQRISQAAVRRANAVERWLDAGIQGRDLRGGAIGARELGRGVRVGAANPPHAPQAADPRPLRVATPDRSTGSRVTLSRRQLLINQRVSQAAIRRLNGLAERVGGRLTGGDLARRAVTAGKLEPALRVMSADLAVPRPRRSVTKVGSRSRSRPGSVSLTVRQFRINQRIAQAAVRRANGLRIHLASGLDGRNFAPGTIVGRNLGPGARP